MVRKFALHVVANDSDAEEHRIPTHKAGRVSFAEDATAEDAFAAILLACAEHIETNISAVADARDPEGVHQIRVGLRRFRAATTAFGEAFRTRALQSLRDDAKRFSRDFGKARELDVLLHDLLPPIESEAPDYMGLRALRGFLEDSRDEAWRDAVNVASSDAFREFLDELSVFARERRWRDGATIARLTQIVRPVRALATESLATRRKKAAKWARHMTELDVEDRHRLRIALKKLRYAAEFFAPVFAPKPVAAFLKPLSKLQDIFGDINDAATVQTVMRRVVAHVPESDRTHIVDAAAFVTGWQFALIPSKLKKAKKRWRRFNAIERFWEA